MNKYRCVPTEELIERLEEYSQSEIAKSSGISLESYNRALNGKRRWSSDIVFGIQKNSKYRFEKNWRIL